MVACVNGEDSLSIHARTAFARPCYHGFALPATGHVGGSAARQSWAGIAIIV
jgi:hypothetical protein